MTAFPNSDDVQKAREQAVNALGGAAEQARTPLLAALGAGDLAAQAAYEAVQKVRTQLNERMDSAQQDLPADLTDLRAKIEPEQLRKRVDEYAESAKQLYGYLAERGEDTLDRLQVQSQVQQVRDQVGTAQDKVGETVDEVRDLADDVLGKVSSTSRVADEQAADAARETGNKVADAADDREPESAAKSPDTKSPDTKSQTKTSTGGTKTTTKSRTGTSGSQNKSSTGAKSSTGKSTTKSTGKSTTTKTSGPSS